MLGLPDRPESRLALAALGGGLVALGWKVVPFAALALGTLFGRIGPTGGACSGDINAPCSQVTATHLSSALPFAQGGTSATTAAAALTALGAAASGANSDITSLSALATPLSAGQGGTGTSTGVFGNSCAFNSANLAGGTSFGQVYFQSASTLTASSSMTRDSTPLGTGTFVAKLCSDGATCGAGNVYLTCTDGANCSTGGPGLITACTVTKAAVAAGTTLTWSVTTACGTTDPAVNACENHTTP